MRRTANVCDQRCLVEPSHDPIEPNATQRLPIRHAAIAHKDRRGQIVFAGALPSDIETESLFRSPPEFDLSLFPAFAIPNPGGLRLHVYVSERKTAELGHTRACIEQEGDNRIIAPEVRGDALCGRHEVLCLLPGKRIDLVGSVYRDGNGRATPACRHQLFHGGLFDVFFVDGVAEEGAEMPVICLYRAWRLLT